MNIIFLIIILGILYLWLRRDSKLARIEFKKGRTSEQKDAIRYFCNLGLFQKRMKDEQFEATIRAKVDSVDYRQRALSKIGLDESELQEVPPFMIEGFVFDSKDNFVYCRENGTWVSSTYAISWLFFSDKQVYFYTYQFDVTSDAVREISNEYFYSDITSFSMNSETEERYLYGYNCFGKQKFLRKNVPFTEFSLTVAGASQKSSIREATSEVEAAIHGMKNKLREKKNA